MILTGSESYPREKNDSDTNNNLNRIWIQVFQNWNRTKYPDPEPNYLTIRLSDVTTEEEEGWRRLDPDYIFL